MNVRLLNKPDLSLASYAARICTATEDKHPEGVADYGVILRCIEKGHESVLEHVYLTFEIDGISRAVLQELARHRIASYSVQSTRWSLKKLLKPIDAEEDYLWPIEFLVPTGDPLLNHATMEQLRIVKQSLDHGLKPDLVKSSLPENFKTKLVMTINLRSLRNFFKLRSAKDAYYQIRQLAGHMYLALPYEIALMVEDCMEEVTT